MSFTLSSKDLEYVGLDLRPVLEAGVFLFGVGPSSDCRSDPDSCVSLNVALSDDYQPACEVKLFVRSPYIDRSIGTSMK